MRPEKQHAMPKQNRSERPWVGQGSTGTNSVCDRAINNNNPFLPDVPLHPDMLHKPSSLHQNTNKISHNPNINLDFEVNSPFQEGIISETIQRPDKSFFQNLKELEDLIDK